jgi:serine protease
MQNRMFLLGKVAVGIGVALASGVSLAIVPNDPLYSSYYLTPSYYQWGMRVLKMEQAWDYATGYADLAAIDNGIQTTHEDLQKNYRPRFSRRFYNSLAGGVYEDPSEQPPLAGHGTHVAGILAASSNNGIGVTGVCWDCSLFIGKLAGFSGGGSAISRPSANALGWMLNTGAQVVNMSFGASSAKMLPGSEFSDCDDVMSTYRNKNYTSDDGKPTALKWCEEISHAAELDVVLVAAAGNESDQEIDFPASDARVIAVGAVDAFGNIPAWSSNGPEKDFVAPGVDILSTIYTDSNWNPDWNCADSLSAPTNYGPCTGTSMAAPHISGLVGILRSINPLLNRNQIKDSLIKHSSNRSSKDSVQGYGRPDALASVKDVLGKSNGHQLVNRLTPLFSLYSSVGSDNLYTTKPQTAMAAIFGELQPQPDEKIQWSVSYNDKTIPGYSSFPKPGLIWDVPVASAFILTTHKNPVHSSVNLAPLYRLSYIGIPNGAYPWLINNVDHAYATTQSEVDAYISNGYTLDGIEGYIYPTSYTEANKPAGTVKLYRKYNTKRANTAIFPESQLASMTAHGYTENVGREWIGYVYPNVDSDSDGVIDGFERILGTNLNRRDSDGDGKTDGMEVNNYPYGDPMNPSY